MGIVLKTGYNLYSWPYPTHEAGNFEVQVLSSSTMWSDMVRCGPVLSDAVG